MSIQHRNIPDAQIHEPKGIISADGSSVYVSTGAGTGQWRRIRESDLDYSSAVDNKYGFHERRDSQFTSVATLALLANTDTNFSNNGLLVSDISRDIGISQYTNTEIFFSSVNAVYLVNVRYKVITTAVNTGLYTLKTSLVLGAGGLFLTGNNHYIKGGSLVNDITNSFLLRNDGFGTFPVRIVLRPDVAAQAYDMAYIIQRLYTES